MNAAVTGAVAASFVAAARQRAEEERENQEAENDSKALAESIILSIDGILPPVPQTVDEAQAQAERMNSPEYLLKDPMNRIIIDVIAHDLAEQRADFERQREAYQNQSVLRQVFSTPIDIADFEWVSASTIKKFFPALKSSEIDSRLKLMVEAGLLLGDRYYSRYVAFSLTPETARYLAENSSEGRSKAPKQESTTGTAPMSE